MATAITALIAFWLAFVGGAVGSFLNVVVYRLPAGMSLNRPGSHCPKCKHPIRWYDNVPVLGWVFLLGRCRDCKTPIAVRYPIVEAITAATFLAVGWLEIIRIGVNLPLRPALVPEGFPYDLYADGQLASIAAWHGFLLATLLAAALIEWDGHKIPRKLFTPAIVLGIVCPIFCPHLHPVAAFSMVDGPLVGLVDSGVGGIVGFVMGRWFASAERQEGLLFGIVCVGLFLGWQAVAVIALLTFIGLFLVRVVGILHIGPIPQFQPILGLFGATLAWILLWNAIVGVCPLPG